MPLNLDVHQAIEQIRDAHTYLDDFIMEPDCIYTETFDNSLYTPMVLINSYISYFIMPSFTEYNYFPFEYKSDKKLILFSGGKLSTAVASMYKRSEIDATLLYVKDRWADPNHIRPNQTKAENIADILNMDLIVLPLDYSLSNPFHILYIIAEALCYAIDEGYSADLVTGLLYGMSANNNPFNMLAYSREFIDAEKQLFKKVLPGFNISMPIPSYSFAWDELMRRKEVLPYLICEDEIDRITSYIIQTDYRIIEPDEEKYLKYFRRLANIYNNETGVKHTDAEVWKRYFFYNMSYSEFLKYSS